MLIGNKYCEQIIVTVASIRDHKSKVRPTGIIEGFGISNSAFYVKVARELDEDVS